MCILLKDITFTSISHIITKLNLGLYSIALIIYLNFSGFFDLRSRFYRIMNIVFIYKNRCCNNSIYYYVYPITFAI